MDLSNNRCGDEVIATASGVVKVYGKNTFGNHLTIKHTLPNGKVVYSLYAHLKDGSIKVGSGESVVAGQPLAQVGNTGMGEACHLHFAIFSEDVKKPPGAELPTGYVYDDEETKTETGLRIPSNTMKYFFDPLLFVDDRNVRSTGITTCCNTLNVLTPKSSILTKTMYATDGYGTVLSLQKAADAGWISPHIFFKDSVSGNWGYNKAYKIEEFVLQKGVEYAFLPLKKNIYLSSFKPGNNYLEARTRQDMMEFVATDKRFSGLNRQTYGINYKHSQTFARAWMSFDVWYGEWTSTYVNVDYDRADPLRRWVAFYDKATSSWSDWKAWY